MTKQQTAFTLGASVLAALLVQIVGSCIFKPEPAWASRNASGTYSLPAGNPVVTGSTISSTTHNATNADLATEMTDSLNRSGKGPMLAALELVAGSVGTPALSWDGDENTGLFWVSADTFGVAAGGALVSSFGATGTRMGATGTFIADSYAASASLDFAGVTDTCESLTITVTGAATNDVCVVGPPNALPAVTSWVTCFVSAADTVTVRHCSHGASGNPAAATYAVRVFDP